MNKKCPHKIEITGYPRIIEEKPAAGIGVDLRDKFHECNT